MEPEEKKPLKKEIPLDWQKIHEIGVDECGLVVYRCKVIGGWLVSKDIYTTDRIASTSVFVPDKKHEWEIKEEKY